MYNLKCEHWSVKFDEFLYMPNYIISTCNNITQQMIPLHMIIINHHTCSKKYVIAFFCVGG